MGLSRTVFEKIANFSDPRVLNVHAEWPGTLWNWVTALELENCNDGAASPIKIFDDL